jgi:hypothetical protein
MSAETLHKSRSAMLFAAIAVFWNVATVVCLVFCASFSVACFLCQFYSHQALHVAL